MYNKICAKFSTSDVHNISSSSSPLSWLLDLALAGDCTLLISISGPKFHWTLYATNCKPAQYYACARTFCYHKISNALSCCVAPTNLQAVSHLNQPRSDYERTHCDTAHYVKFPFRFFSTELEWPWTNASTSSAEQQAATRDTIVQVVSGNSSRSVTTSKPQFV